MTRQLSSSDFVLTRLRARVGRLGFLVLVALVVVGYLLPIYWVVKASFEPTSQLLDPHLLPRDVTIDNYVQLFTHGRFMRYVGNSVIIAVGTMLLTVVCATLAGYALTRFQFRGQKTIARSVLFVYMFPAIALAIPLFTVFRGLDLLNTPFGLILAHSSIALPFGIWMMWQLFQTVPRSYQESAYTLGAGRIRTAVEVEMPQARAGIVAVAIFAFAQSWEDYTFAFILTSEPSAKTITLGMSEFVSQDTINWGLVTTSAVLVTLPALLIVATLQRYLIKGIGAGGLKG